MRSRSIASSARGALATGPTIEHPASPRIASSKAAIIASSSTISTRRPASLPSTPMACPPQLALPRLRLRERDAQIGPKSRGLELEPRVAAEPVAPLARDQRQAEAAMLRRLRLRPIALGPIDHHLGAVAARLRRPGDPERSVGRGQRTVLRRIGSELVQDHSKRDCE